MGLAEPQRPRPARDVRASSGDALERGRAAGPRELRDAAFERAGRPVPVQGSEGPMKSGRPRPGDGAWLALLAPGAFAVRAWRLSDLVPDMDDVLHYYLAM